MLDLLPGPVLGTISLVVLSLNTVFWSLLLFLVALLKMAIPIRGWRIACSKLLDKIGQNWVWCNNVGLQYTKNIIWDIEGNDGLALDNWYLVLANHQTWVDIVVLQKIFHQRTPMLRFFLKKELIWVPVLGIAWWALDFPFMRRSTSVHKDFETAREACEKFELTPTSIMNFVEGTRFTSEKRQKQNSPFRNLLKPKAAGIAIVIGRMGERLHAILDVTIVYPDGVQGIWAFLCSRSMHIRVRVRQLPVASELLGDYLADRAFRKYFNKWLDSLWTEKDRLIEELRQSSAVTPNLVVEEA